MPLFKRGVNGGGSPGPKKVAPPVVEPPPEVAKPRLVFHCQQAQGSPTGLISGFSNVKELYAKIAECYEFPASEVGTPSSLHVCLSGTDCCLYKYSRLRTSMT
ncbi:hypothetical protein GE061_007649 [Apolygus lucorum]|uniref:GIPC1-3 GH1 domain-containing protein n=1 Tax=Apolygus lucorum TaxID=248454 RepID=A0A8S9WM96_APOLU|nr:hypothetical protein GE061_007649 [Apolygus lucorum]